MTEKLGMVRICAGGTFFDSPYFEGFDFNAFVSSIRAAGYWHNSYVYIPHSGISYITQVPDEVISRINAQAEAAAESRGATRQ